MMTSDPPPAPPGSDAPRPEPPVNQSEAVKEKKDLTSWWKNFKRTDKKGGSEPVPPPQGIFGVPLSTSVRYANVAISLFNDEGQSYIYGYVPIIVAKCGVFLKEKATDVEGIFRLAGSEKRIKDLKVAFDSPDRYGKGLDWSGFTVHDAANILRRYFNQLPEPIIPLDFYQRFRDPLKNHHVQAAGVSDQTQQSSNNGEFNPEAAIPIFQRLITELPPLNRQLLLYILDLLAVFASKSDMNKMTTPNLAAIFQPGILNHPKHGLAPHEYRLSQDVLVFLIVNQDSFLIGMQGTAVDADTVRDVQSGSPVKTPGTPTTPNRSKTVLPRSGSSSSIAADNVRMFGSVRRNMSVSSKHSKRSEVGPTPASPTQATSTGGVQRSNTVPSRRNVSAAHQSPRFSRDKGSDATSTPGTPAILPGAPYTTSAHHGSLQNTPVAASGPGFPLAPDITSASSSEATTPLAKVPSDTSSAVTRDFQTPKKDTTPLLAPPGAKHERSGERSFSNTPSTSSDRKFFGILKQSPSSDDERRKPNKLQKKRVASSTLSSAHSSSHSLHDEPKEKPQASPNLANYGSPSYSSPSYGPVDTKDFSGEPTSDNAASTAAHPPPMPATPQRNPTDATLKPTTSPPQSYHSHTDDTSDADMVGDDMPAQGESAPKEKKRARWRLSRTTNKMDPSPTSTNPLGTMNTRELTTSKSTIGSGAGSQPRRSFQEPAMLGTVATDPALASSPPTQAIQPSATDQVFSDSEREKKGLFSRLRDKMRDNKDSEKRVKSPERAQNRTEAMPIRGKSFEQQRGNPAAVPVAVMQQPAASSAVSADPTLAPKSGLLNGANVGNGFKKAE